MHTYICITSRLLSDKKIVPKNENKNHYHMHKGRTYYVHSKNSHTWVFLNHSPKITEHDAREVTKHQNVGKTSEQLINEQAIISDAILFKNKWVEQQQVKLSTGSSVCFVLPYDSCAEQWRDERISHEICSPNWIRSSESFTRLWTVHQVQLKYS